MTLATDLSVDALYETARSLADRGLDYGYNVYYKGNVISPGTAKKIVEQGGEGWLEAFRHAIAAYKAATGETWRY